MAVVAVAARLLGAEGNKCGGQALRELSGAEQDGDT